MPILNRHTAILISFLLIAAAVPALVPTVGAAGSDLTFEPRQGNEWWVDVRIGGADAAYIASVDSRDSYGDYVRLAHTSWGSWAGSFHVEPGHLVKYRVTFYDGRVAWSCAYEHPSGAPSCGSPVPTPDAASPPAPAPAPAPSPTSGLTFGPKSGNEWWVEVRMGGGDAAKVAKVGSRDSYADVVSLVRKSWGSWGASYHVEPGHVIMFRATLTDGTVVTSCAFAHPSGVERCGASVPPANATNPTPAPTPAPTPTPTPTPAPAASGKLAHTGIVSTTFWVGEIYNANLADGSQVCSTYDSNWAYHWSGVNNGKVPSGAAGCAGAIVGGCDGVPGANNACKTEKRTAANGYFPTSPQVNPKENPFYLDLPYDDLNDPIAFKERCSVIPWANDPGFAGHCSDGSFSYMKNHWVKLLGPNGNTCYGQVEDAGPSHGSLYHDKAYVFGTNDARPTQTRFNNAGMDVSPALNGCLGFASLDGQSDRVSWSFVDAAAVPAGPWTRIITTSQVTN